MLSRNITWAILITASLSAAACGSVPCQEYANRKDAILKEINSPDTPFESLAKLGKENKELDKSELSTQCKDKVKAMSKDEKIEYVCSLKGDWAKDQCNNLKSK